MAKNSGIRALKNLKNKIGQKSSDVKTQRVVVTKKPAPAPVPGSRVAAKKDSPADFLEDSPKLGTADKAEKTRRFKGSEKNGFSDDVLAPGLPNSRLERKRKGFLSRTLGTIAALFSAKKSNASRTSDALAFADNNRRMGRKGRRNRMIFLYAGTGLAVVAVLLIVFLAPGGVAAPAEATERAMVQASAPLETLETPSPTPILTPDPTATVLPGVLMTPSEEPTEEPTATPTIEPTEEPTPVPTTAPDKTATPVDMNKLAKYYIVEADKYYNDMGYSSNHYEYTEEEYYMLAQVIDAEARGESYEGKVAVGNVVMNRVLCRSFPGSTIKDVVTRAGQFAYNPSRKPSSSSKKAARAILDDELWVIAQDVYYFRSGVEAGINWGSHKFYTKIGGHCFYRHSYSGRHRGGDAPPELFDRTYKYAQYGCKRENRVKRVQYMLNKLGYDVKADGYFGEGTKDELKKFQEKKGLEADGVAGPSTVKALIKTFGVDKYIDKWGMD
jgi:spore germination cell wall hydrolase CwlJ-like protein